MWQSVRAALDARKDRQLTYHTAVADWQRAQRNLVELKSQGRANAGRVAAAEEVREPHASSQARLTVASCLVPWVASGVLCCVVAACQAIAQAKVKQEGAKEQLDIVHKRVVAEMKRFKAHCPVLPPRLAAADCLRLLLPLALGRCASRCSAVLRRS